MHLPRGHLKCLMDEISDVIKQVKWHGPCWLAAFSFVFNLDYHFLVFEQLVFFYIVLMDFSVNRTSTQAPPQFPQGSIQNYMGEKN